MKNLKVFAGKALFFILGTGLFLFGCYVVKENPGYTRVASRERKLQKDNLLLGAGLVVFGIGFVYYAIPKRKTGKRGKIKP